MKKFSFKSFFTGLLFGSISVTTIFAAQNIKNANFNDVSVNLNGDRIKLQNPLVSIVTMEDDEAKIYMPVREILETLGYEVNWNSRRGEINLIYNENSSGAGKDINKTLNTVLDIKNKNEYNISESGSFIVEEGKELVLDIQSDISGGTVNLFILDPDGRMERITISSSDMTKKLDVIKGTYQYNCSGSFSNGGSLHIQGIVE